MAVDFVIQRSLYATVELSWTVQREGMTSKKIRESENLPECLIALLARARADQQMRIKTVPMSDIVWCGIFYLCPGLRIL